VRGGVCFWGGHCPYLRCVKHHATEMDEFALPV
jgi:hypothetical protein